MKREPCEGTGDNVRFLPTTCLTPRKHEVEVLWRTRGFDNFRVEKCILQKDGLRNTFYLVKIFRFKFGFAIAGEAHEHF